MPFHVHRVMKHTLHHDLLAVKIIKDAVAAMGEAANMRVDLVAHRAGFGMTGEQIERALEAQHIIVRDGGAEDMDAVVKNVGQVGVGGFAEDDPDCHLPARDAATMSATVRALRPEARPTSIAA